ncbi:MAG: hypothetical protein ACO3EP_03270 [Phycisphaerales bacterium]
MTRRLALLAPIALASLPLACEDSGVADSRQAQAQLAAARTAYLEVVANRPTIAIPSNAASNASDDEEARQIEQYLALRSQTDRALSGIANQISSLATNGNAAAGLMLAEVKLDQAKLRVQDLLAETTGASTARRAALAMARAAADLEAAAAANDATPLPAVDALRRSAGEDRRAAASEQALIETERRSAERLAESIESFRRRAGELNAGATELQRQASAQSPIDAYALIAESADLRRMANEMAVEAAGQEIAFEIQENAILDRERDRVGLEARASGREQAATVVAEIGAALSEQSAAFRRAAAEIRQRLVPAIAAIELDAESAFGQAAAAARTDFDAAAGAARRARSGGSRDLLASLDWLVVAARQGEAAVSVLESEAFAAQASFFKSLLENIPNAAEADRWRRSLESASTEAGAARARADEVFSEIAESLESLPTGGGETATLIQQELQAAMSSFSQRPLGTPNAGGRVADESVGSATASAGGPPFASPEALLAFLQRGGVADGNAATMEQVFRATSPAGRRMLKATLAIAQAAQPVAAAMMETFGESSGLDRLGGGAMPGMESARMVSSDGSQATIEVDGQELTLISEDGGWFADFDSMLPAGDPTQMAMQAGMLEGMAKQMGTFFSMFAQRIRDGEFASAEEAGGAMQQEMMAAMMGAAGGSR